MRLAAVLAIAVTACEPPQPTIDLQLSAGPAQECPSTDCNDIAMSCRMFMSIRILSPDDQTAPLHSECLPIPMTIAGTLCPIGGLELQPHTLPYRDLEVQVAIYPEDVVGPPSDENPFYQCPVGTKYDFTYGFPIAERDRPTPALGGRGYYRPGDDTIQITLGCSNLEDLANDQCEGIANTKVTATVEDFDTHLTISRQDADRLVVSVGEPVPADTNFVLRPNDLTVLERDGDLATWSKDVPQMFAASACVTVDEDTAGSTTTARCLSDVTDKDLTMVGLRLTTSSLNQILRALSLTSFPPNGLTVGVVLDNGIPIGGQLVTTSPNGNIEYLDSQRISANEPRTSSGPMGGVFVSRDSSYGTLFSTSRLGVTVSARGGNIADKVTVIVLDLAQGATPK